MKKYFFIYLMLINMHAFSDSDGDLCVGEDFVYIDAAGIYLNPSEFGNTVILIKDNTLSEIERTKFLALNDKAECVRKIHLPYIKTSESIVLQSNRSSYITLLLYYHAQTINSEYGSLIVHHFSASVAEHRYGDYKSHKLLANGARLETID